MPQELLRITIYKDINKLSRLNIDGKIIYTNQQNDLFEAIKTIVQYRLDKNYKETLKQMKEKGAIKTL